MVTSMYAQCLKTTWKTWLLLGFLKIKVDHQLKESDWVVWDYHTEFFWFCKMQLCCFQICLMNKKATLQMCFLIQVDVYLYITEPYEKVAGLNQAHIKGTAFQILLQQLIHCSPVNGSKMLVKTILYFHYRIHMN